MDGGGGVLKVQGGRVSGGVTFHTDWMPGKGIGVNDRGDIGVATGDAKDGMKVNSPGDAKAGAADAVGGSKSGAPRASTRSTKIIASRATIRTAAQPRPPSPDQRPRARRRTSRS
jgi:hypothetical protein